MDSDNQYVLHIYRSLTQQVTGKVYVLGEEICGIGGCASVEEAIQTLQEGGQRIDFVVDGNTGEAL